MTTLDGRVLDKTYMYVTMLYFLLFGDIFDSNQSQLILFLGIISSQHINVPPKATCKTSTQSRSSWLIFLIS